MKYTEQMSVARRKCDVCGQPSQDWDACKSCGKDFCYDCKKTNAVQYTVGVFHGGSGDATWCLPCSMNDTSQLHVAYVRVASLKREYVAFQKEFELRQKAAEKILADLLKF